MLSDHPLSHLQSTALHFYESDYNINFDTNPPTWLDSGADGRNNPDWVGQDKECNDGGKVELLPTADTITLDACATKCEEQPGCFLFAYTETTTGENTCEWQKTPSRGRCNNYEEVEAVNGDFKGLFLLRTGAWAVPRNV